MTPTVQTKKPEGATSGQDKTSRKEKMSNQIVTQATANTTDSILTVESDRGYHITVQPESEYWTICSYTTTVIKELQRDEIRIDAPDHMATLTLTTTEARNLAAALAAAADRVEQVGA